MEYTGRNVKIAVIGGDERQIYAAVSLADRGFEVALYGLDEFVEDVGLCTRCFSVADAVNNSKVIILPSPVSNDAKHLFAPMSKENISVDELIDFVKGDTVILGGRTGNLDEKISMRITDYFEREEFVIANAYLTAESAISLAMNEMKESLRESSVLVMGYGRIGKSLCHLLKGMGVNVYASARKKNDFAWIRNYGYSAVDTGKVCDIVSSCKLIFNTIPRLVLGEETLSCMHKDSLIVDLASKPGGVDFEAAQKCGIKTLWALSLPGKRLPKSAGKVQADVILDILDDMEVIQ